MPAAAVPRVAAPSSVRAAIVTSTEAPTPRAPAAVGARKTLEHRTVPSAPPVRPIAAVEASSTEAAAAEAAPAESVTVETAMLEGPRKRVLLVLSKAEDEEEVPSVIVSEAPLVTIIVTELAGVEAIATDAPSPPPISSTILIELVVAEVLGPPSAAEGTNSSDDLEELYASLHEERGSSASTPLDEDSRAVIERL
ncbi:unnamed protein product [Prunus armeniaca]